MRFFAMGIHWAAKPKSLSTKLADLKKCKKTKTVKHRKKNIKIRSNGTYISIGNSWMNIAMLSKFCAITETFSANDTLESLWKWFWNYICMYMTVIDLLQSCICICMCAHSPLEPSRWIFLCFAKAFMFVEVRPQMLHVTALSTWMLFICERKFSLFLYLKSKIKCKWYAASVDNHRKIRVFGVAPFTPGNFPVSEPMATHFLDD